MRTAVIVAVGFALVVALFAPLPSEPTRLAKVLCSPSVGMAQVDPIAEPGKPRSAHLHEFFGSRAILAAGQRENATYQGLVNAATSCENRADTAVYWTPALLVKGKPLPVHEFIAYYYRGSSLAGAPRFAGPGTQAYPPDMRIVAGDPHATGPQPTDIVWWNCGAFSSRKAKYTSPAEARCDLATDQVGGQHKNLTLHITFPDCWDGQLASRGGRGITADNAYLRYSDRQTAQCPASHPRKLPTLTMDLRWDYDGDGRDVTFSSGSIYTAHADFLNSWDQAGLERFVQACVNPSRLQRMLPGACGGIGPAVTLFLPRK